MSGAVIELCDIDFAYPASPPVFRGLNFALMPGERVALTGANGSGKSTLLHLVTGLLRPDAGTVRAFGKKRASEADFREVRRSAGYLLQDSDDQLFCPTVLDDVMFGPLNFGLNRVQARERALGILGDIGLAGHADRVTYKLSGGEKRLVALASVLAMEPQVLLLDEPTAGLDRRTESRLAGILRGLRQDIILVSHNQRFMAEITNRQVTLGDDSEFGDPIADDTPNGSRGTGRK